MNKIFTQALSSVGFTAALMRFINGITNKTSYTNNHDLRGCF